MSVGIDETIGRLAAAQYGRVSFRQLLAAGISREAIRHRIEKGTLIEVQRGVFAVGHQGTSTRARWAGAVLACGPGAALSHRHAAMAWELMDIVNDDVDVLIPHATRRRWDRGIRTHRTRFLPGEDVGLRFGIRTTTIARVLLDLTDVIAAERLEDVCARATRRRFDLRGLPDYLARRPGRANAGVLERIVVEQTCTLTRSELERIFLRLCRRHGLPPPLVNSIVHGEEVDFWWPAAGVVVETDGYAWHRTPADLQADHRKHNALALRGVTVLRYSHGRLVHRELEVAGEVGTVLRAGRWAIRAA